jgi:hypothetical protein
MNIAQEYYDKYRYSLRGPLGFIYISQPINWNDDNKTFKRSLDTHGVFINLANNLEFYIGEQIITGGYQYLKDTNAKTGINSVVLLVKEENISGKWYESYRGYLDFSTYHQKDYTISMNFNESGIYEKIKARQNEELELDRLTTMDGDAIEEMPVYDMQLDGRKILIISELKLAYAKPPVDYYISSNDGHIRVDSDGVHISIFWGGGREYNKAFIPITMVAEQDGNVQSVTDYKCPHNDQDSNYRNASSTANMFYDESPNPKTLKMDIDIAVKRSGGSSFDRFTVQIVKYGGNLGLEFIGIVDTLINVANPVQNQIHTYTAVGKEIPLLTGESLGLAISYERGGNKNNSDVMFTKLDITITDETYDDPTPAKFVMPFESLERILRIITNRKGTLISTALGRTENGYKVDGEASLTGLTNGFWVRQFNTEKITTSFDDFMDSFQAIWQLGYGIEKTRFSEKIRVEHISYFYQEVVTIELGGEPSDITRKCGKEYFYSSVTVGYNQPSGAILYEEVLGLDEYNIKNSYTTPITRVENKMLNESKYRADSYGTEFARRKPKSKYPQEDTRYDLSVMVQDLKRGDGAVFKQRKWADDFIVPVPFSRETTGVYSPETATNLRFSPMNTLKRMGYWIKGGFMKNLDEYVRYSSSNGNSKLKTLSNVPGSFETAENGNVLCSMLDKNLFNPEIITFKFAVDTALMNQVTGTVSIDGNTIMNYYGLVEFINEYGQYEYGYLLKLEPNGDGKWELLSSTKRIVDVSFTSDCKGVIEPPINLNATDITP